MKCICLTEILSNHFQKLGPYVSKFNFAVGKTKISLEIKTWWRHQMETFSALLAICAGNSPVTGDFPAQRPGTWNFDVFFYLRLNKRLSKKSWGWWFGTPSSPLWRHCNDFKWTARQCIPSPWINHLPLAWQSPVSNKSWSVSLFTSQIEFCLCHVLL